MCAVYSIFALMWLTTLACYWRDLVRLQFWIGAVIVLGLLEKAVLTGELQSVNDTGIPS